MIRVGPDVSRPTHHIKLSRGGVEVGLILCDSNGDADETAIRRDNMPDSAIKMYSGASTHADAEPPFRPVEQKDWSGGRGARIFEDATDRYYDGSGIDATKAGKLFLNGLETYTTGLKSLLMDMPGSVTYTDLYSTTRYLSHPFTTSTPGFHAFYVEAIVEYIGDPGNITLAVYSDNAGSPGTLLASIAKPSTGGQRMMMHLVLDISYSLSALTTYHVVVYGAATDDLTNHWRVAVGSTSGKSSADGTTWATASAPYSRLVAGAGGYYLRFFEYMRAFYAVKVFDSGANSLLYRCGSRGAADSNAGFLDRLIDAVQTHWTTDSELGKIVMIYKGPGSEEFQPWREVDSNTATVLYPTEDWLIEHTTETEYIVFGDTFHYLADLGGHVSDIAVTDDYVYFARGEDVAILRYQEYNNGGVWTTRSGNENEKAVNLLHIYHPSLGSQLFGTRNDHPTYRTSVFRGQVPKAWGNLYQDLGIAFQTETPWDSRPILYATQSTLNLNTKVSIDAAFTTGTVAVHNLTETMDISKGNYLGVLIESDVALSSGDLQLTYNDQKDLYKYWSPSVAFIADYNADPPTYEDMPRARDGTNNTAEVMSAAENRRIVTTKAIYLFHSEPFNRISLYFGTPNTNIASLIVKYFNGYGWAYATDLSDGTATGIPPQVTFGQNGEVTFDIGYDWEPCTVNEITGYGVMLEVNADLTDALTIVEIHVGRVYEKNIDFPAIAADTETWALLSLPVPVYGIDEPNRRSIKSVGLKLTSNKPTAINLTMRGGIRLVVAEPIYKQLPADSRIVNIKGYAGSSTEPVNNPWLFTDTGVIYEMQTQSNDQLVPLALDELRTLQSENTGRAVNTQGLYLWFTLGKDYIQRYYNHQLDNMGYNKDEGLPVGRRGRPVRMITWTDNIIVAVDGGEDNDSSVLIYNGRGWHELYRAPEYGIRIRDIAIQVIPDQVDRLWINLGDEAIYMPLSTNPLEESGYRFSHFGSIQTARITGGLQDVIKYVHSLKLAAEFLTAGWYTIQADYKLAGETDWTYIEGDYDTEPYDELQLSDENDVTTRWISLRLRFYTRSYNVTPVVYGTVLQTMMFSQIKFVYTMTFRLKDKDVDLLGDRDPAGFMDKFNQLDEWVVGALPVLFNTNSLLDNDTYVFPGPTPIRRLRIIKDPVSHEETHVCQMTLIGI